MFRLLIQLLLAYSCFIFLIQIQLIIFLLYMISVTRISDIYHIFKSAPKTIPTSTISPPSFTKNINASDWALSQLLLSNKCFIFFCFISIQVNPNYMPDICCFCPLLKSAVFIGFQGFPYFIVAIKPPKTFSK